MQIPKIGRKGGGRGKNTPQGLMSSTENVDWHGTLLARFNNWMVSQTVKKKGIRGRRVQKGDWVTGKIRELIDQRKRKNGRSRRIRQTKPAVTSKERTGAELEGGLRRQRRDKDEADVFPYTRLHSKNPGTRKPEAWTRKEGKTEVPVLKGGGIAVRKDWKPIITRGEKTDRGVPSAASTQKNSRCNWEPSERTRKKGGDKRGGTDTQTGAQRGPLKPG